MKEYTLEIKVKTSEDMETSEVERLLDRVIEVGVEALTDVPDDWEDGDIELIESLEIGNSNAGNGYRLLPPEKS
jgi:ribosomal 50S subunit-associated protein YjgA (DUF615 family)